MKTKRLHWVVLATVLGLVGVLLCLSAPEVGRAESGEVAQSAGPSMGDVSMLAAAGPPVDGGVQSIAGSSVEMPRTCYVDNTPNQQFCFTVNNGSTDGEWIDQVTLTFPAAGTPWTVNSCIYQDATDSVGYTVNFSCTPSGNQVVYQDNDADGYGEISNGASWEACVDVTVPSGYSTGPRYIPWVLDGDKGGQINTERIEIDPCGPVVVWPETVNIQSCNGVTQTLEFEVWNVAAGNTNVDFVYDAPQADFTGPSDFYLNEGGVLTFTTQLKPNLCLEVGEVITAAFTAMGNGHSDSSDVTITISDSDGWRRRTDSLTPTMDSVVVWASHADGGLWSIGGYGSNGATQRYDPGTDTWQTFQSEAVVTPLIEYPVDGCYGLDDQGDEIVVLFPDTLVTDTLHVFNITDKQWFTRPIPGFFPGSYIGHWGFDVVSLLNNPSVHDIADTNMCYLSGGNHQKPGGGTTRNLWRYDPELNSGQYITDFVNSGVVFGFHASWYVPWIGTQGSICVAGGADHNHYIHDSTQCIDLATGNPAVENLGTLPEPWWGMADGWQINADGEYEIWIANGVAQDGTLLPSSAYFREGMSNFEYGPPIPHGLYRLEGDAWNNQFYTLNGSRGGFWYSEFSMHLSPCPICYLVDLPLVLRDN